MDAVMENQLADWAEKRGYEIAWGGVSVLNDVRIEIEGRQRAEELDEDVERTYQDWVRHPDGMPIADARSVIVIALPRPAHTVSFTLEDGPFSALVPPQYLGHAATREGVREDLAKSVFRDRHRLEALPARLKAVAARLGLVVYGRNNITYTTRFGSYQQLIGLITDAELGSASKQPESHPDLLSTCQTCGACLDACPTGAIVEDRFLLHAERCLAFHNENPGEWPEYVTASTHDSLVGCMGCQQVCPANAGMLRSETTGVCFSGEETAALLADQHESPGPLGREIAAKLEFLDLAHYGGVLGRNLRALVEARA